jgi:hypothetical protein
VRGYKVYAIRCRAKFKEYSRKWIKEYHACGPFVGIGSNPFPPPAPPPPAKIAECPPSHLFLSLSSLSKSYPTGERC